MLARTGRKPSGAIAYNTREPSRGGIGMRLKIIKPRLIKIIYDNGVEVSREVVNKSTYKMVPRTVSVGVATGNPDAYNQLQEAIATGSIDHVCAVAGALAAQAAPAPEQGVPASAPVAEVAPEI